MVRAKSEVGPQLAAAYGELVKRGEPVTVRSLRAEAGVATSDAAAWLRANRTAAVTPAVPADELAGGLAALWAVAVSTARDEVSAERAERESELVDAETRALEEAAETTSRVEAMTVELEEARAAAARDLERAQTDVATLTAQLAEQSQQTATERQTARDAETRAARAEATVETLQRLVDQYLTAPPTDPASTPAKTRRKPS